MKATLFTLIALLPLPALAVRVSSVNILTSPSLQGAVDLKLEVKKEVVNLRLVRGANSVALKKPVDVKSVKLSLTVNSSANLLPGNSEAAAISGELVIGKEFRKDSVKILSDKIDLDIRCASAISSSAALDVLTIDLQKLTNLSSCGGKDIAEYSPYHVGKRRVDDGSNFFSLADDERMGREFVVKYVAENADKILPEDHPTTLYLQEKMELIARNSDMPNLKPKVRVINADVLNAFALPGGYVFVFRGLMEKSPSEAALLGVLGHEWAHVTARHGTKGMTRSIKTLIAAVSIALVAQTWAEVTDDKVKKLILPLIAGGTLVGAQLRLLARGREQELEADRLGAQYALLAGYHPRGIGDMFETFKKYKGGESTSLEKILSSHPEHDTRIQRNHLQSALFYPERPDYVTTSYGYEDALAALTGSPLPLASDSVKIATSFVEGLQSQQEELVLGHMKGFIEANARK